MRISVYIPSYNQRELLEQALLSVLNQTLKPFEIIVVDDCSNDDSVELVQTYAKQHDIIKLHVMDVNTGIAAVRTKAVELATGDAITYVDGDDLFAPQKLENECNLLVESGADLVFSNFYRFIDAPHKPISVWACNYKDIQFKNWHLAVFSRKFPTGSIFRNELVNLNFLRSMGGYDPNLKIYEDFELKIRMAKEARIAGTLEVLSYYRDNPSGLSKSKIELHKSSLDYIFSKHIQSVSETSGLSVGELQQRVNEIMQVFQIGKPKKNVKSRFNRFLGR
jgi:glycosyltransferase involved in cell wall biosynthesis